MRHATIVLLVGALFLSAPFAQTPDARLDAPSIRAAIERALGTAPRALERLTSPAQAGVGLNRVDVHQSGTAQQVVIDLSQKTLTYDPTGDVERLLDHLLAATARLTSGPRDVEYHFRVDGLP